MLACFNAHSTHCSSSSVFRFHQLLCGNLPNSTRSLTVKSAGDCGDWVNIAKCLANSLWLKTFISFPSYVIFPLAQGIILAKAFKVVLLPQPLGPIIAVTLPLGISKLIPFKIVLSANFTMILFAFITPIKFPSLGGTEKMVLQEPP